MTTYKAESYKFHGVVIRLENGVRQEIVAGARKEITLREAKRIAKIMNVQIPATV